MDRSHFSKRVLKDDTEGAETISLGIVWAPVVTCFRCCCFVDETVRHDVSADGRLTTLPVPSCRGA